MSPLTGPLAGFGMPMTFLEEKWNEALANGVECGDGLTHKIVTKHLDTQSDSNRAGQVTGDLINNDKVDVILVSSSPDTVLPVAGTCESFGVPCIASFVPWQPFFFGLQKDPANPVPFKWCYAHALGLEEVVASFIDIWNQIPTNKMCGFLFANDADGIAWTDENTGLPPAMKAAGYTVFNPGLYAVPTDDFTRADLSVQEERVRDLHRHGHRPRLHRLLAAGVPGEIPAEDPHLREGVALPRDGGGNRRHRRGRHGRIHVGASLAVQVLADR